MSNDNIYYLVQAFIICYFVTHNNSIIEFFFTDKYF